MPGHQPEQRGGQHGAAPGGASGLQFMNDSQCRIMALRFYTYRYYIEFVYIDIVLYILVAWVSMANSCKLMDGRRDLAVK